MQPLAPGLLPPSIPDSLSPRPSVSSRTAGAAELFDPGLSSSSRELRDSAMQAPVPNARAATQDSGEARTCAMQEPRRVLQRRRGRAPAALANKSHSASAGEGAPPPPIEHAAPLRAGRGSFVAADHGRGSTPKLVVRAPTGPLGQTRSSALARPTSVACTPSSSLHSACEEALQSALCRQVLG